MKFLHLIWSNLKRRKLRTSLTMLAIFVAFFLFGLLCTVKEALTAGVTMAGADRLVVRHKVSLIMSLPVTYKTRMEQLPGVASAVHFTWFNGIYKGEPKNFFGTFPTEPETFLSIFPEYTLAPEQRKAWLQKRTGAIVGRSLANDKRFNFKVGDTTRLTSPIWPKEGEKPWEFEIVGIYDSSKKGTDNGFYFRYDYFDEARARGKGLVGWYAVKIKDPDHAAEIAKAIDNEFANSPYETKAEPEGAFMQGFAQQMGDIGAIVTNISGAVFLIILLLAGNTMAQAVRERTQELGVLKSLGFTNERVLALVLAESCFIALLSGLTGVILVWLIALRGSPMPQFLPVFFLPYRYIAIGAGLALGLGILAGIIPAFQAMRLQIATALRRNA